MSIRSVKLWLRLATLWLAVVIVGFVVSFYVLPYGLIWLVDANTYSTPAWHLAIHTEENMPDDCEDEDVWAGMVDELREAAGNDDVDAVWDWYSRVFPKCMELVPVRRKDQFVQGIRQAWEDDRL